MPKRELNNGPVIQKEKETVSQCHLLPEKTPPQDALRRMPRFTKLLLKKAFLLPVWRGKKRVFQLQGPLLPERLP